MRFKYSLNICLMVVACILPSSCSKDENLGDDNLATQTYNIFGKVEKGPFVEGSTITIQPMNAKLQILGELYSTTIKDNTGNFSFGEKQFKAPYAEMTANGYFYNEVSGYLSSGTLNLRALVSLSDKGSVNVNILTHIKYQRVLNLVAKGKSFIDASKQAQEELFTVFGLQKYSKTDASSFSIAGGNDESAVLIAISSLLIVGRSEAELTEYLAKLSREFGESGNFPNEAQEQIEIDKKKIFNKLSSVKNNVIERYEELGIEIDVKDLAPFFDWDNDGIAGNEALQEGQEVIFETTQINVPNEGGTYTVKITSPIPVYLEQPQNGSVLPPSIDSPDNFFSEIYESKVDANISFEKNLEDGVLTIKVSQLESRTQEKTCIPIYDYAGNILGEITILQEGNNNISIPKLGSTGKQVVASIATSIAEGFSNLNLLEQYYHYNKDDNGNLVEQYIYPTNREISNIWASFYRANRTNLMFKEAESKQLAMYQDYFNVFSALYYYYMIVAWGDVPYIDDYSWYQDVDFNISRTNRFEVLSKVEANLEAAINYLEEKKNESLKDANNFFFLSKDVARILLADIYMYQGDYTRAESLLRKVIDNDFYALDTSNYSEKETIDGFINNGSGKESIFILKYEMNPRIGKNVTISNSPFIPIMTYTDVVLSYAECLYKNGRLSEAKTYLNKVVSAKSITVSENTLIGIKDARMKLMLYCVSNFAFLKRNNIAEEVYGVKKYQLLFPIPQRELDFNSQMEQNPGY